MATVVLVGTLDTKGIEYAFVKKCLIDAGVNVIVIDTGVLGEPPFTPDISAADVVEATGTKLAKIRFANEGSDTRAVAIDTMCNGLSIWLKRLYSEGKCDAVLGMGGSGGTSLISQAMQKALPIGVPKLIVSTMMAGNIKGFVGSTDMTMMHSVTDIAGLNRFSRLILANAAHAAAGMAEHGKTARQLAAAGGNPLVAITMFGITTPGVLRIREGLEKRGFETIVFHAVGSGGMAMETMIKEGLIDGVIDYTLAELCSHALGGIFSAGPDRLTAASLKGIPQVIVPGAIEVLNFGARNTLPSKYDVPERKLIVHNPNVCAVKANKDELRELGKTVGLRASAAKGPTAVLLPLGGLDKYEAADGPWYDPETDAELFKAIHSSLSANIEIQEINANINDPLFADTAVETFVRLWEKGKGKK